ncbi:MAG TPA: PRC-barrel domain-containing protein [Anaerolineales bacterium]|nr:PRC-barrel domain-containing protein [Anaerolineales bacterium]
MRFNYGVDIVNFEGEKVGELRHVIVNPDSKQVTHLVAQKGFLLPNDKVIPISLVMDANNDHIKLYDFEGTYDDLDDYVEAHFVKINRTDDAEEVEYDIAVDPLLAYPPSGTMGFGFVPVIRNSDGVERKMVRNIPFDTNEITKGAPVLGLEGEHVGDVEEVIIEPQSDKVTHFVISKGMIFTDEKLIPSSWVKGFDDDQLKLVVDSTLVENLPEYDR